MAKTVITERKLYEKRNTDNILIRNVIGGLLKLLNNRLVYDQTWDDTSAGRESITIPFYYDMGNPSTERFLQDNYTTFGNQCGFKQINGNFDVYPRGIISVSSVQIQSDQMTNRMVLGRYQREDETNGEIRSYVALMTSIPLNVGVSVEIRSKSFTDELKIDQACKEFFYKNHTFYTTYKGTRIGCRAGFPESFKGEKMTGYTMGTDADKQFYKQNFDIAIECYQPVFDYATEQPEGNTIKSFSSGLSIDNATDSSVTTYSYSIKTDTSSGNRIYPIKGYGDSSLAPSGSPIYLRWGQRESEKDINSVKISYIENGSSTFVDCVPNHQMYDLDIPENFTQNAEVDVVVMNNDEVTAYKSPVFSAVPDPSSGYINYNTLFCVEPGYFIVNGGNIDPATKDCYASVKADITVNDNGSYKNTQVALPIKNNKIETRVGNSMLINFDSPVLQYGLKTGSDIIKVDSSVNTRNITIRVEDANDKNTAFEIKNITIV